MQNGSTRTRVWGAPCHLDVPRTVLQIAWRGSASNYRQQRLACCRMERPDCHAMSPPSVPASGVPAPRFWTVSIVAPRRRRYIHDPHDLILAGWSAFPSADAERSR